MVAARDGFGWMWVAAGILASWAALALFRRFANRSRVEAVQGQLGATYAPIYEAYAIVLGLIVVGAWQDFQDAETVTTREGSSIVNLVRLAGAFPDDQKILVLDGLDAYATSVLESEWPAMAAGQAPAPDTQQRLNDLYAIYAGLNGTPAAKLAQYEASIEELDELDDARGSRLLFSQRDIPQMLWAVLLIGAAITVGFAYLFSIEDPPLAYAVVGVISAIIGLLLGLGYDLSTPYSGPTEVELRVYERVFEAAAGADPRVAS